MNINFTGKGGVNDLDSLPSHGMHGGPLVSVVIHYEDGSSIHLAHDNPFIKSITKKRAKEVSQVEPDE